MIPVWHRISEIGSLCAWYHGARRPSNSRRKTADRYIRREPASRLSICVPTTDVLKTYFYFGASEINLHAEEFPRGFSMLCGVFCNVIYHIKLIKRANPTVRTVEKLAAVLKTAVVDLLSKPGRRRPQ
jgi:hypothetical protein